MWNLEKDPHLSSSIANVTLLDQAPDPERLRSRLERAAVQVPRLRQRVVPALGRLAPPEWRDEPDFDLDYHLRWSALPNPGSMRQLLDLTATFVGTPFDRTRPLWEFLVIEGLEGGRAAMVQKLHHAIADGEGSIRMSEQFIDIARDATEPIAPDRPVARRRSTRASSRPPSTRSPTSSAAASASLGAPPRASLGLLPRPDAARRAGRRPRGARAVGDAPGGGVGPRPLAGVDRALAAAPHRGAAGADRRGQGGGQGAGRQPQRLLRGGCGRRRRRVPPQGGRSPSTSCASRCR